MQQSMGVAAVKASIGKVCDAEYYTKDVAQDRHDYYAGHGEAAGRWAGTHAGKLGLEGEVDAAAFAEVLANHHPVTGEKLKPHDNLVNLAFDVTFSPVKSVSVLWALGDRDTQAMVVEACEAGHAAALAYLEYTACVARLGRQGQGARPGQGFAAAVFRHRCSREGDPQLHWHTVIANVAEADDGRAAALDGALLYAHASAAAAIAERVARIQLAAQGVVFERREERWEVAAVSPALCRTFSKRRTQIEQALAERGVDPDDPRAAQHAALATRTAKTTATSNVHDRWYAEARAAGYDPDQLVHRTPDVAGCPADDRVEVVVEALLGPEGLTAQASSFGRRDVLLALADRLPVDGDGPPQEVVAGLHEAADRLLADPRVIPLLHPTVTSGEVIRPRDRDGRITGVVRTCTERRYSTVDLLLAEHELLQRGRGRADAKVAQVSGEVVGRAVAGKGLDVDQEAMVRAVTGSGAGVDVVVGKAGTGKTTAIDTAVEAFKAGGHPVLGVAPTATAAHQLARATGLDTSTVDRLLVELEHGRRRLAEGVVVVLDEAGMCSTRKRLALQRAVDAVRGKVIDVGDDRQIPSVDVGGGFHALGTALGASTLGVNHRFRDPQYRDAADLVWHGHTDKAIALLEAAGAVYEHPHPDVVNRRMVADWASFRSDGSDARMFATTHTTVTTLNDLARAHLTQTGQLPRRGGRTYVSPDGGRALELRLGERVRLGANDYALRQPDGTTRAVTNGMEGHVIEADRRGVTVQLDPQFAGNGSATVRLPASYAGQHLRYGYAITADSAQGSTIDHGLYAPAGFGSLERGYVALTRGALSSRIYATPDNGWRTTLGLRAAHIPALSQHPDPDRLRHHLPSFQPTPAAEQQRARAAVRGSPAATADRRTEAVAYPPLALVPPPVDPPALDDPADENLARQDVEALPPAPVRWLVPLPDPPPDDDDQAEMAHDLDDGLDSGRELAQRQVDPPALAM